MPVLIYCKVYRYSIQDVFARAESVYVSRDMTAIESKSNEGTNIAKSNKRLIHFANVLQQLNDVRLLYKVDFYKKKTICLGSV